MSYMSLVPLQMTNSWTLSRTLQHSVGPHEERINLVNRLKRADSSYINVY